jgi:enamine deaminase RidA (YjgF/YER057c/UK114 family)
MTESNFGLSQTLERLKLKLPPPPKAVGAYRPMIVGGERAYLSGQLSKDAEGRIVAGKVGGDLSLEEGKRAAQWAALQAGSLILHELGLKRVGQILRMAGFVQSAPDFHGQSEVMNSASELLVEIFGERGRHARTSIGVASLPLNAAVEIELTLQLK